MNRSYSIGRFALFVFLCLVVSGCGKKLGEVTGTVSYKGKNLKNGSVLFSGSDGVEYTTNIDESGQYTAKVILGDAKVRVTCIDDSAMVNYTKALSAASRAKDTKKIPSPPRGGSFSLIPEKYNDYATSGLSTTVKSGKNPYDIDLK